MNAIHQLGKIPYVAAGEEDEPRASNDATAAELEKNDYCFGVAF
jgi:hypothetical protein